MNSSINEYPKLSISITNYNVSPNTMTIFDAEGTDAFHGQNFQAGNGFNTMDLSTAQSMGDFIVFAKNVRGMGSNDRLQELILETKSINDKFDILVLSETWRVKKYEYFTTHENHLFTNAGCNSGRRGVGFLVHNKWVPFMVENRAVSERISYIRIHRGRPVASVTAS